MEFTGGCCSGRHGSGSDVCGDWHRGLVSEPHSHYLSVYSHWTRLYSAVVAIASRCMTRRASYDLVLLMVRLTQETYQVMACTLVPDRDNVDSLPVASGWGDSVVMFTSLQEVHLLSVSWPFKCEPNNGNFHCKLHTMVVTRRYLSDRSRLVASPWYGTQLLGSTWMQLKQKRVWFRNCLIVVGLIDFFILDKGDKYDNGPEYWSLCSLLPRIDKGHLTEVSQALISIRCPPQTPV